MELNAEGNLLEIMDLARTLRQEQLFIQQEQSAFGHLTETLAINSASITRLAYICAQQRQNLNDLIISRPDTNPTLCCRRADNYENPKFIDARKVLEYEHALAYEDLFNYLYRSPILLAISLSAADKLSGITPQHLNSVIQTITSGIYGNAINTKDVEMLLKLLRELIEIQIVVSDNPRRLLRANSSAFARLYHRLNESMFSAKIFLTAALYEPIMSVLSDCETLLDMDPNKVIQNLSSKERLRRFGLESSAEYQVNVAKFHSDTLNKLHALANSFIDSLTNNWSLFPSTLRWLVQTMSHHLKQAHFSDKVINEIICDMVFTHFICPAIISPDIMGIIDAPISEQLRFNLIQIGQIIQMLALSQHEQDVDPKFAEVQAKFNAKAVTDLIELLLVSQTGEDVVAILAQQSEFERNHLLCTQNELKYFTEFFRILLVHEDEYEICTEERQKLKKVLGQLPEQSSELITGKGTAHEIRSKDSQRSSKQGFMHLGKSTKNKIAKTMSFSSNSNNQEYGHPSNGSGLLNGTHTLAQAVLAVVDQPSSTHNSASPSNSTMSSPSRALAGSENCDNETVLVFNIYNGEENKLQPLTEEEVLKMNSIGQEMSNDENLLVEPAESCNLDNTLDKSSVANGYDGIDTMNDVLRPLHSKGARFSLSHDDASIGNSDNLEAVSEAPSNHSVTSSLELEENDQNDNLSDMVSANVSGRGTPNISGRDTPSSQVTDGESVHNAMPTPQMQKLLSKARSDIEDKFCKFEIKKFEGDETVSIISDTWSTDVLASDSETLDASERERDRNFSTPLIPSAVILPGDNNFVDALAANAAAGGNVNGNVSGSISGRSANGNGFISRRSARNALAGFFDASDQRSESNWSTDVLASDSEKLNEMDTDDNASITAKSDITDAGTRSEIERDHRIVQQRLREVSNNLAVSAAAGVDCNGVAMGGDNDSGAESSAGSARSQEDSTFFDAVNLYDDAAAVVQDVTAAADIGGGRIADDASSTSSFQKYQLLSSLARSSVRTTNQFSGENNFQQNYKSSCNEPGKEPFPTTPRMRRQTSAESSISNQSLNLDEVPSKSSKQHKHSGGSNAGTAAAGVLKKKRSSSNNNKENEGKDLIDFSDFGEEKPKCKLHLRNRNDLLVDILSSDDAAVEHRRISMEQRSTVFDGRRNGIMAMKTHDANNTSSNRLTPALRRHQSLNYENHEIMLDVNIPKRISAMPVTATNTSTAQTDDDKQQELILCARTAQLHLDDNEQSNEMVNDANEPSTSYNAANGVVANDVVVNVASTLTKPIKSTGAIPKSISFDATADKTKNSSSSHAHDVMRHGHNSGIFNKLKQGIFKHRRSNKPNRHSILPATAISSEDFAESATVRSVSFNTSTADVTLDLMSGSLTLTRNGPTSYTDITEDILAKYRRKVSTSSETTNSDSTCNSAGLLNATKHKGNEMERRSPNGILHDKAVAFNIIKKKIRTVLSKTDLHTSDFRHTTYSNAPPLLTYLRIQLAQALNLQNFQQISYVSEAIRCITTLERAQHTQLLEELQNDIRKRQNYLQYLMRFRQNLILIMENIEQYEQRLRSESATCNRYLLTVCVRMFLEKRQEKIEIFQEEFARVNVSDDKIVLIEEFIDTLVNELSTSGGMLCGMPEWQIDEARVAIERILLQRMYQQVMFPNEDADLSRDSVLSEHISKLQRVIRPSHPALCIPQEYLSEAPWLFAQQQLSYISAYKTPKEKLHCVIRCISSIMSLLHMSSGRVPAADDILPVLIYVVIMANPPYLLSTVEYITCFIGDKLDGEEEFHWTLFGSVVKFIKTMDYLD